MLPSLSSVLFCGLYFTSFLTRCHGVQIVYGLHTERNTPPRVDTTHSNVALGSSLLHWSQGVFAASLWSEARAGVLMTVHENRVCRTYYSVCHSTERCKCDTRTGRTDTREATMTHLLGQVVHVWRILHAYTHLSELASAASHITKLSLYTHSILQPHGCLC